MTKKEIVERLLKIFTFIIYLSSIAIYEIGICNGNQLKDFSFSISRVGLYVVFIILLAIFSKKFTREALESFKYKVKGISIILYIIIGIVITIYLFGVWTSSYQKATLLLTFLMGLIFLLYVSTNYIKNTIILTFSLAMVFTISTDFNHGLDEKKHMMSALNIAGGNFNYIKNPMAEPAYNNIIFNCDMDSFAQFYKIKYKTGLTSEWNLTEADKLYYVSSSPAEYNPIVYLPSALGIVYTKTLGGSIADGYITARLFNLIAYLVMIVGILKILPYKKKIFFLIYMMPFTVVLSASLSIDGICIGILGIFIAYCLRLLEKNVQNIKLIHILVLMVLFLLCLLVKDMAYFAIILFVFILPVFKILKNNKKGLPIIILMIIISMIICGFFAFRKLNSTVDGGGDPRGGETSVSGQIEFLKSKPSNIVWVGVGIITNFLLDYRWFSYLTGGFFGKYASQMFTLQVIIILYASFTDCSVKMKKKTKIVSILTFLAILFSTSMMLYLTFTPVGEFYVAGYQPRYLTPILPLVLMVTSSNKFLNNISEEDEKNFDLKLGLIQGIITAVELTFLINVI